MEFLKKSVFLSMFLLLFISLSAQNTEKLQTAFKNSYAAEIQGKYSEAVKSLKAVYDPASYLINVRLGWLSYMQGQFTESAAYYQKAIELKPYAIEARFGLSYPASAMGNWTQVKDQYIKIMEIDPMNSKANYYYGLMLYENAEYESALKHFEKVANMYPFDADGVLMYAWSNFQLGKSREAEVLFKEVLLIDPGNESAMEGLGLIK
jgi:tetratricopeptide (TPR) repeat protein